MGADVNSNIGLEGISTDIQLFNPFDTSVMTTFQMSSLSTTKLNVVT